MTRDQITDCLELLRAGARADWSSGWPVYDPRLLAGIDRALALVGDDQRYLDRIRAVRAAPIEQADAAALSTWLTWVRRGERFSDGHIDAQLESGALERLLVRVLERLLVRVLEVTGAPR